MEVERGRFVFIDLYLKVIQYGWGLEIYVTLWIFVNRVTVYMSSAQSGHGQ
jgi:hypothetical protein